MFSRASGSDGCPGNLCAVWFFETELLLRWEIHRTVIPMVRRWDSVRFFDDVGHLRLGRPPLAQKLNLQVSQGSSRLGWQPYGCDQGLWSTKQTTTLCSSFLMPTYEDFLGVEEGISRWMFAQPFVEIDVYIIYTVRKHMFYVFEIFATRKPFTLIKITWRRSELG